MARPGRQRRLEAGVSERPTLGRPGATRRAPPGHRRAVSARHTHLSASNRAEQRGHVAHWRKREPRSQSDDLLPSSSIPAGLPVHVRRRPRSRAQRRDRAPATADEIVKVNEESRIDGLRSSATVFALLALIALTFTRGSQPSSPAPRPNPNQSGIEGPSRSARWVSKGAVRRSTRLLGWGWKGALSAPDGIASTQLPGRVDRCTAFTELRVSGRG